MKEVSIVRYNMMTRKGYVPYCGNNLPRHTAGGCSNPRVIFVGRQFVCPECGWRSNFEDEFIQRYIDFNNEKVNQ